MYTKLLFLRNYDLCIRRKCTATNTTPQFQIKNLFLSWANKKGEGNKKCVNSFGKEVQHSKINIGKADNR